MPRCPNGTRRNKKTGLCQSKKKRCPNGTRKNKKTGKCEGKKVKSPKIASLVPQEQLSPDKNMYNVNLTIYLGDKDGEPMNTINILPNEKDMIISHIEQNVWSNINDYISTLDSEKQFQLTPIRISPEWTADGINITATISLDKDFENSDITEIMKDWFDINQMSYIENLPYVITGVNRKNIFVEKI